MGGIHARKGVLHHVAAVLSTSEELVRKWKSQDKWTQRYLESHPEEFKFTELTEEQEEKISTVQIQKIDITEHLKKMITECDIKSEKVMQIIKKIEYQGDKEEKESEKVLETYKAILRGVDTITKLEKQKFTYLSSLNRLGETPKNSNNENSNNNNNLVMENPSHITFYMPCNQRDKDSQKHESAQLGKYEYQKYTVAIYDSEKGYLGEEEIKEDTEGDSCLLTN